MLYADSGGKMYEHPDLSAGGRTGSLYTELRAEDAVLLPGGASLVLIPQGTPVGIKEGGRFTGFSRGFRGEPVFAVGALLPQGYTRTLFPAFTRDEPSPLPLFGYAAVGWKDGKVYTAALKTDDPYKWDPVNYCTPELAGLVEQRTSENAGNRIIRQLGKCALEYRCFTAQNIFYRRWEGGIPVSPACNARCMGCISLQPAECCPSPQNRISFTPSVEEIVEIALPHLEEAEDAIISFGQGCEGEPSLAAREVSGAVERLRGRTGRGTINMNTNAGYTEGIREICSAGIDSLRVSTVSAIEDTYNAYYMPQGYTWNNVCSSISLAREQGVYVSLNLLTFPGLTDLEREVAAMADFIREYDINMVQVRNLNIDPDFLASRLAVAGGKGPGGDEPLGIDVFLRILREEIPGLEIGNYSKPVAK
jgi:pyruvate-formate lyase-activating enzyme